MYVRDAVFPALDVGRIDVIANQVSVNEERAAEYGLSDPYTYSRGVIVRRTGDENIKTLEDLRGKTTAQSSTSNRADAAKDAGAKVEAVEGFSQAAALLTQGRVDAIVKDNIAVLDYQAGTGFTDVEIEGNAGAEASEQVLTFRRAATTADRPRDRRSPERGGRDVVRSARGRFLADGSDEGFGGG